MKIQLEARGNEKRTVKMTSKYCRGNPRRILSRVQYSLFAKKRRFSKFKIYVDVVSSEPRLRMRRRNNGERHAERKQHERQDEKLLAIVWTFMQPWFEHFYAFRFTSIVQDSLFLSVVSTLRMFVSFIRNLKPWIRV